MRVRPAGALEDSVKASDMRELSADELRGRLEERQKDLMNFRLQLATGVVENNRAARMARRDIARIHTIMRERELAAAANEQAAKKGN